MPTGRCPGGARVELLALGLAARRILGRAGADQVRDPTSGPDGTGGAARTAAGNSAPVDQERSNN
ncbi:hypothetical protein [Streptomyces sp. NPDC058279]|uniref:hypothetical protein n=1 Tax=Streptomyces sp. NPDC058279 TaxID=3346418 RepID=UPI0036EC0A2D